MGRISRGWALTQQSWEVLRRDRSLVVFPILSTIFTVLAATGAATISAVTFVVILVIAVAGAAGGGFVLAATDKPLLAAVVWAIAVAGIIVVSLISAALSQIFRVAVYHYAVTGEASGGFDRQLLEAAFVQGRKLFRCNVQAGIQDGSATKLPRVLGES